MAKGENLKTKKLKTFNHEFTRRFTKKNLKLSASRLLGLSGLKDKGKNKKVLKILSNRR